MRGRPTEMRMPQVVFQLANQLRLSIATGDITKVAMDGIVNAANERMLGGGGVDGAIHRAAGDGLYEACKRVSEVRRGVRCPTGEARITPGFELPSKHVIHTVGPIYEGDEASAPLLRNAHMSSLELASENGLETVAFPAISCGVYGYPIKKAARIAVQTCKEFSEEKGGTTSVKSITFLLFGQNVYDAWVKAAEEVLTPLQSSAADEPLTAEKKEQKPASDGVCAAKDDSMESDAKKARTVTDAEGDGGDDTKPEVPRAAMDVAEDGSTEYRTGKPAVKDTEAEQDTIAPGKVEAKDKEPPHVQSGTGDLSVHGQVDSKESKPETVDAVDTKPETDMEVTHKDSGENTRQGPS